MHPNQHFRQGGDWLDFADARGFAHIFAATPAGPFAVQAPVSRIGDELHFHVSRANRIAPHLDGAQVIASIAGVDGYISPNWYAAPVNQVPTWNYTGVEIEGVVRAIDAEALTAQLDALAARHEPRVNPANPWTRAKMDPALFAKMLTAIRGFAFSVEAVRETVKLGQHKGDAARAAAVEGVRQSGQGELAEAMARI